MISYQPRINQSNDVIHISVAFLSFPRQRLVQWFKNDVYLQENHDVIHFEEHITDGSNRFNQKADLTIMNSTDDDLGIYTLKIANVLGMAEVGINVLNTRNGEELNGKYFCFNIEAEV